jgi:thioesterase domain-containing protein
MQPTELQTSLHERIPLSRAMGVTVLQAAIQPGRIVIRRSAMDFERPIVADFTATALPPSSADWARLLGTLQRGRMGRIAVRSVLDCAGERVGELEGEFAVIPA